MRAIREHAIEPFKYEHRYWAAVLVLQRLLTVVSAIQKVTYYSPITAFAHIAIQCYTQACDSLMPSELHSELGVSIVSVWFLLLQALVRPYRVQWVNHVQLMSSWCLVMVSILNAASSSAFVSLGVNIENTPFKGLRQAADWMMFLLLWPPAIMWLLCTTYMIGIGMFTLALLVLFGAVAGSLIGTLAASLQGAALGALVGAVVGAIVGSRSCCKRRFQRCQTRFLGETDRLGSEGTVRGGAEQAGAENTQFLPEKRRHEREKKQLLWENEQLLREKEQLLREKEQEKQEREQLLAQLAKFETAQREGGESTLQEQRASSSARDVFVNAEAGVGAK
jgi:hypothetical protein